MNRILRIPGFLSKAINTTVHESDICPKMIFLKTAKLYPSWVFRGMKPIGITCTPQGPGYRLDASFGESMAGQMIQLKSLRNMRVPSFLIIFLVFVCVTVFSGHAVAAEGRTVIFVTETVQNGLTETSILVPQSMVTQSDSLRGRVQELFEALKVKGGERYEGVVLELPEGFDLARKVILKCQRPDPLDCEQALAEVGATFAIIGVERVTLEGSVSVSSAQNIPARAFIPVFPFWAVLPPAKIYFGLVRIGNEYVKPATFYARLRKSEADPQIIRAARKILRSGPITGIMEIAQNARELGILGRTSLSPLLNHSDSSVRVLGIQKLSLVQNTDVLSRFASMVDSDSDPKVKLAAVRALVDAGDEKYRVYLLMEDLQLPDEERVITAIKKLVATGDRRIGPSIQPLLFHGSLTIRSLAADGLIQLKLHKTVAKLLDDNRLDPVIRSRLARAMTGSQSASYRTKALEVLLSSEEGADKVFALSMIREKHITGHGKSVVKHIGSTDTGIREHAIRAASALKLEAAVVPMADLSDGDGALAKLSKTQLVTILVGLGLNRIETYAGHSDPRIRAAALQALGSSGSGGSSRIRRILLDRIGDKDIRIRRAAVTGLAGIANISVADRLLTLKGDLDAAIRVQVVKAIVSVKHSQAGTLVSAMLADLDPTVKLEALRGVNKLSVKSALPQVWRLLRYGNTDIRREALATIVKHSSAREREDNISALAEMFYDTDEGIRSIVIDAVRGFRNPLAYSNLGALVTAKEVAVQTKAIGALSQTQDPRAVEYVVAALFERDPVVKNAALDALQTINSMKAEGALREYIQTESDTALRDRATEVLDNLSGD